MWQLRKGSILGIKHEKSEVRYVLRLIMELDNIY